MSRPGLSRPAQVGQQQQQTGQPTNNPVIARQTEQKKAKWQYENIVIVSQAASKHKTADPNQNLSECSETATIKNNAEDD